MAIGAMAALACFGWQLFQNLDLEDVILARHSTGGCEVARFLTRHGSSQVEKAALVGAVTPPMRDTEASSQATPIGDFDSFRGAMEK